MEAIASRLKAIASEPRFLRGKACSPCAQLFAFLGRLLSTSSRWSQDQLDYIQAGKSGTGMGLVDGLAQKSAKDYHVLSRLRKACKPYKPSSIVPGHGTYPRSHDVLSAQGPTGPRKSPHKVLGVTEALRNSGFGGHVVRHPSRALVRPRCSDPFLGRRLERPVSSDQSIQGARLKGGPPHEKDTPTSSHKTGCRAWRIRVYIIHSLDGTKSPFVTSGTSNF